MNPTCVARFVSNVICPLGYDSHTIIFFGFGNFESKVIQVVPGHQLFHLSSVHGFIVLIDKTHHSYVISILN